VPLLICFLNHNILFINAREDDKLDTGQTVLVKRLFTLMLSHLFCVHDCEMPKNYLISQVRTRTHFSWPPKMLSSSLLALIYSV